MIEPAAEVTRSLLTKQYFVARRRCPGVADFDIVHTLIRHLVAY